MRNVVCDTAALNKTSRNNQASARTNPPHKIKEGESSVSYGHIRNLDCHTEDTKNEGGKYYHIKNSEFVMKRKEKLRRQ